MKFRIFPLAMRDKRWPQRWSVPGSFRYRQRIRRGVWRIVPWRYVVSIDCHGYWGCSCLGWTTHVPRKDCRHIHHVKEWRRR